MPPSSACAVCGERQLQPHLAVAGESGPDGMIPSTDRFGSALGDIVRCPACGHMQLEPMPGEALLTAAYEQAASADYLEEELGQRETARHALSTIERFAPRRGRLLDVGCWVGFLLDEARVRGWDVAGLEPSDFGSRYAQERLGLDVVKADLLTAQLEPGTFDAVVMGDVIEHLTRPDRALSRTRELLVEGGVLWLVLPDAGSRVAQTMGRRWWSVIPTHVQYFTRGSIAKLLVSHGFQVLDIRTAPKAFSIRYYLDRVSGYSRPLGRALVRGARAARIAERMWAPDFRDRMALIARAR
ncbi:MAG: class I SAM-dependent methyltransferase [Solirubrobacterales bacterium]|nr:class I SAM-dependent methyltransferase [Solirubrobacterales bacterium]